jgi:hypothetical protein
MPDIAKSATPGPVCILFIDVSGDRAEFEHNLSRAVFGELKNAGIALASDDVIFADDVKRYEDSFKNRDFNTLLLLFHGCKDPRDGNVSTIVALDEAPNYYGLAGLTPPLRDKLVCLAVCHGSCEDARQAFLKEDHFALTLVAPKSKLSKNEVRAFFPPFFRDLNNSCTTKIDPNVVKRCVDENNHFANKKMRVDSDALSHS